MNLTEIMITLFILFVLALAGTRSLQSRDEAELSRDVEAARDLALAYANLECSSPAGAVTLANAVAALGTTAQVQHPNRWRIVLTPRPGLTGPAVSLQYRVGADTWQWVHLLNTYPATAQAGHVRLHVHRRPGTANRRGFQGLLENALC